LSREVTAGWKRALPGLVVSALALAVVFALSDPRRLWDALRRMPPWAWVGAALLLALSLALRAAAWRVLLLERVAWAEAFWALDAGYLVNNIIPFRAGEATRALLIAPKAGVSFWHALSTVLVERLLDVLMLAGLLVGSLPWVLDLPWARRTSWVFGGAALGGLLALMAAARYRGAIASRLEVGQQQPAASTLRQTLTRWLLAFLNGLEALTHPGALAKVGGLMALSWAVQVLAYTITLQALVPRASWLWAAFALGSVGMGIAVPSAPGGVGVMEGVIVFVLGALGIEASVALAYALVMHGVYYLVTGLLGWIGITVYGVAWRDLMARVRAQ